MTRINPTILLGVVALVAIGYLAYNASTSTFTNLAAGAGSNPGILLDSSYDLQQAPESDAYSPNFADLVHNDDYTSAYIAPESRNVDSDLSPMERLSALQGKSMLPRTSKDLVAMNVDVANPSSYSFSVSGPRVQLKSRFQDYGLASMIRGDTPIKYHPDIALISKTVQGRDDLKLNGLFTDHFVALYNRTTGNEYKNLPMQVAGAGQATGYGGASGGVIMDHY